MCSDCLGEVRRSSRLILNARKRDRTMRTFWSAIVLISSRNDYLNLDR